MRILHVGAHIGNIGDTISNQGFYNILSSLNKNYTIERLEIRKSYLNYHKPDKLRFDSNFIEYANKFDLLVIGGGGYLGYWVPNSATGTTIDITPELIAKIKVRTLITSVGCFNHTQNIPEGNFDKFRNFLDTVFENKAITIAIRNDGSDKLLQDFVGKEYEERLPKILDSGFFYQLTPATSLPQLFSGEDFIALNIPSEQLLSTVQNKSKYTEELLEIINHIIYTMHLNLVFVPHIFRDLETIFNLLCHMDDFTVRQNVFIAPCIQGKSGADYLFSIYNKSRAVIATRFHANIGNLTLGKNVFGLATWDRIKYLHESIGSDNYGGIKDFSQKAISFLSGSINHKKTEQLIKKSKNNTLNKYREWLENVQ
jgi:polysaccharide pyruvyl transferase WcaK-like protein